jgi:hypothetical protein
MNLEIGQRVIHKVDMKEGTVVQVDNSVAKVVFDGGEISYIHRTLLAEKLDGLIDDKRDFLIE